MIHYIRSIDTKTPSRNGPYNGHLLPIAMHIRFQSLAATCDDDNEIYNMINKVTRFHYVNMIKTVKHLIDVTDTYIKGIYAKTYKFLRGSKVE